MKSTLTMNPFLVAATLKRISSCIYMCKVVADRENEDEEMASALFHLYRELSDLSQEIHQSQLRTVSDHPKAS